MGLFVLLLIYGIPAVLALVGIAFLIRAAIASKTGAPSMGRKAETLFSHATVVDKVHYYTTAQKGFFHFYCRNGKYRKAHKKRTESAQR